MYETFPEVEVPEFLDRIASEIGVEWVHDDFYFSQYNPTSYATLPSGYTIVVFNGDDNQERGYYFQIHLENLGICFSAYGPEQAEQFIKTLARLALNHSPNDLVVLTDEDLESIELERRIENA